MRKLLITGGAGFIGVNAARHFAFRGMTVTLFDNFSRKGTDINVARLQTEFPSNIIIVRGDVSADIKLLHDLMEQHDYVLHLAAQVAVTTSVADPRTDFNTNALGTFNVLEAIRASRRKPALIYSSTNKVYGALRALRIRETGSRYEFVEHPYSTHGVAESHQLDFHSPYGSSKGAGDQYVLDYSRIYGLQTVVFRQSCIYGPHQFGVEDQGWVAWFLIAVLLGRPITIFGNGKQVRDLLHVRDLLLLYDLAFEKMEKVKGQAYNIGGGKENALSLLELLEKLEREFGHKVSPNFSQKRTGDQAIFIADNRKVLRDLGWSPQIRSADGIKELYAWLKENRKVVAGFFLDS